MKTNTTRFSDRVEDYIKYRPKYPVQMLELFRKEIGLHTDSIIADIGSGTGISSEPFVANGNNVFGVEPNTKMRQAAEQFFSNSANHFSINGTAEQTGLTENSIDVIFAGQAFHWFDKGKAKLEFSRILKKTGHIVLGWNVRSEKTDFQKEYDKILRETIPEYSIVTHKNISDQEIRDFFSPRESVSEYLVNAQILDLEGLKGRLKSSSYCPKSGQEYESLINKLTDLFTRYESNGLIEFAYDTHLYWCR